MDRSFQLFRSENKLADILQINPQLILILSRFNIGLGFGEKSISEICQEYKIQIKLFLILCNVYTFDYYYPEKNDIKQIDGIGLVNYLKESHKYYLEKRLIHIGKHIEKIAIECGNIGKSLNSFFCEYVKEVKIHFEFEEKNVYPIILNNSVTKDNILQFRDKHTSIEDKLNDLTNIIIKYLPEDILPDERISVWFDITQVYNDITKHDIIEEKILLPFIQNLTLCKQ